ncbi:MmgE/PrpD family protein [Arenibaculum sp.]|jgi:2-methylcitrate dehydratase PrpD|uniref:MmgE/PrpD family protein n=1 Tax=Arenibaculum sp. TaxID=2865862 RepID=UPI002E0E43B0|nr:MmgE/PrpD family protein [Arenibaculum sp.]
MANAAIEFIHGLTYGDLPPSVVHQARRCLLDLIGVAVAGRSTALSRLACDFAAMHMGRGDGPQSRLLFDGRGVSPTGAAFAGAATIDSFDAHDGHRLTKGHAGVAVLPALLAYADADFPVSGEEFLACLVLGYEIGTRAGIALHGSVSDYHTSGAWNALACAAIGARLMGLGHGQTRHALGIAEYHGPRSQMMRCIDHPTMVKDGSAFGALAGVSAAYLARAGFTGAPAVTVERCDPTLWMDLGSRWTIMEQYFKPYPVCRWAQPAIEAALALQRALGLSVDRIEGLRIHTFHEGTRLAARKPSTTEEAQYSTPFAVAAALVHGRLGAYEISGEALAHSDVLRLAAQAEVIEDPALSALFPDARWARVNFLVDGHWVAGEPRPARGDPEFSLSDHELMTKFTELSEPHLPPGRRAAITTLAAMLPAGDMAEFLEHLLSPT